MNKNQEPLVWDEFATQAFQSHITAIRDKADEIARRCALPTVNDYTFEMAIKEVMTPPKEANDLTDLEFIKLLISKIPHDEERVPYIYHHDYIRSVNPLAKISRADVGEYVRKNEVREVMLYAAAYAQIFSESEGVPSDPLFTNPKALIRANKILMDASEYRATVVKELTKDKTGDNDHFQQVIELPEHEYRRLLTLNPNAVAISTRWCEETSTEFVLVGLPHN